jgi:hypothetical protein
LIARRVGFYLVSALWRLAGKLIRRTTPLAAASVVRISRIDLRSCARSAIRRSTTDVAEAVLGMGCGREVSLLPSVQITSSCGGMFSSSVGVHS